MHDSVMEFCRRAIMDAKGKRVLEVGAYDVNGTVRSFVEDQGPEIYIGTDLKRCDHHLYNVNRQCIVAYPKHIPGKPCADIALPAEKLNEVFSEDVFDIVICTEVMEHVEDWDEVISNMAYVLKWGYKNPGGYMVITTRSPGFPYHEYPIDKWRFTKESFREIFDGWDIEMLEDDPEAPGVFIKVRKKNTSLINKYANVKGISKP